MRRNQSGASRRRRAYGLAEGGRTRGFTLIEIVIVVAIIGIMAALAANNMSRQTQRSRFRNGVREIMSMIADGRSYAIRLGGAVDDGRVVDTSLDCPVAFLTTPGVVINTVTNEVTSIVDIRDPPLPNPRFNADGHPLFEIDCTVESFQEMYRSNFLIDYNPTANPGTLLNNGPNLVLIGFNGRGMAATLRPNTMAGRVIMREPADRPDPMGLNILVNGSGQVCIESDLNRCSDGGRN